MGVIPIEAEQLGLSSKTRERDKENLANPTVLVGEVELCGPSDYAYAQGYDQGAISAAACCRAHKIY